MSAVVIWVSNLEVSLDFYGKLFGATDSYKTETFASVSKAGNEVLLHLLPEQYRNQPSIGEENPIKPIFEVNNLDSFAVQFRGEVIEHSPWRYADLVDPDGHIIQIRQRIS